MNSAEKLSREVARVTTLRENYLQVACAGEVQKIGLAPAIILMKAALEGAHVAAGSGDAEDVVEALKILGDYTE